MRFFKNHVLPGLAVAGLVLYLALFVLFSYYIYKDTWDYYLRLSSQ